MSNPSAIATGAGTLGEADAAPVNAERLIGSGWRLQAHVGLEPLPLDWRDQLADWMGQRPRRLGVWTEAALYGALNCQRAAGETQLPPDARLRLASRSGPVVVQREALCQLKDGLPMPFAFMQSQPAIALAALAQALRWQGDAAFLTARDPEALRPLCLRGAGEAGALWGWVEVGVGHAEPLSSEWWRWSR